MRPRARTLRAAALFVAVGGLTAALSPLVGGAPTYDPWAWLVWGREVVGLDLVTQGGPSWKPLPVLLDVPFVLAGDGVAPALWLAVARAAGAVALLLAVRLAWRLAEGGSLGALAGLVAGVALVGMDGWLQGLAVGHSEGMLIALVLAAVERHLDGRRGQALLLGAAAALLRPEVWPFLALYALARPASPRRMLALGGAVLLLWFLPEWWGSGDLLRSAERANDPQPTSVAYAERPALEVLRTTGELLAAPLLAAALAALVAAAATRAGAVLLLGALTAGWTALIMAMTEAGFSGNPRYGLLAGALLAVLAGVGAAALARAAARAAVRVRLPAKAGAAAAAVLALAVLVGSWPGDDLARDVRGVRAQAAATSELERLVARLGGREGVLACGRPTAGPLQRPVVAWMLGVHLRDVAFELAPGARGLVLRTRGAREPALPAAGPPYRTVARLGRWEVLTRGCAPLAAPAAASG